MKTLKNANLIEIGKEPDALEALLSLNYEIIPSTLPDLLALRTHENPDREIFHFVESTVEKKQSITYKELYKRASCVAKHLDQINSEKKPVLLLFNCNLDYLVAFFGCLIAGQIAVPVYPPTATKHFDRLQSIIDDSGSNVALLNGEIFSLMEIIDGDRMKDFGLKYIAIDQLSPQMVDQKSLTTFINPDSTAFLQYTSGSTGQPKGVMLSHKALLANLKMIKNHYQYTSEDRGAMWLPLYHDMGLIGGILTAIYNNMPVYFMPPQTIIRPFRWLKLMSDIKATASGGPNFAFEMCLSRVSEKEISQLDLSSLRFIASGAEPVRSQTVAKFIERFKCAGLREDVIMPCYGLAEVCVYGLTRPINTPIQKIIVDSEVLQQENKVKVVPSFTIKKIEYVSCGVLDNSALIIDPASLNVLGSKQVGELVLKGPHLMSGYWNNPGATSKAFITLNGQTYLRTGDLVFADDDKNIYFCGRNKDILIVRGKNYYATDLEISSSKSHPGLTNMVNAAFSYDKDEKEVAVLVQEIPFGTKEIDFDFIKNQIQHQVVEEHNFHFDEIIFVRQGSIKRTSAGKVRRLATKDLFLKSELKVYKDGLRTTVQFNKAKRNIKDSKVILFVLIARLKAAALSRSKAI